MAQVISYPKSVCLNRPLLPGVWVLELAKVHMGTMYYKGLKHKFKDDISLLYTDTDSFVCSIRQKNWLNSLKEIGHFFDFSNLDINHPLFSLLNKNTLGKFKFELKNAILLATIFLRSKCYSILIDNRNLSIKEKLKFQPESQTDHFRVSKSKGKG